MSDPLSGSSAEVVRDRHLPRLCRSCQAPIARQEAGWWRCGVECAYEPDVRTALIALTAGMPAQRMMTPTQAEANVPYAGSDAFAIPRRGGDALAADAAALVHPAVHH